MTKIIVQKKVAEHSLKKRYLYKLSTNIVIMAFGVVTQAIIPRGLGPKDYGNFNFLSTFFTQTISFLELSTSIGFYTKLSQRPREAALVSFYSYFTFFVLSILLVFVFFASDNSVIYSYLWPDQKLKYIWMAALFSWGMWFVQVLNKMVDAYGLTVSSEIVRIYVKALGLVLIIVLYLSSQLNLLNFFYYHYVILVLIGAAFIRIMGNNGYSIIKAWKLTGTQVKKYIKEFHAFSHPLFFLVLVVLVTSILDRWLLQYFSGSVQQGYFGLSFKIGEVCILFTAAMTPLLMREFSVAFGKRDFKLLATLHGRYVPLLYSITAFICCYIAIQADKVIYIMGGVEYRDAIIAVTIMAFYPIHQAYGQLSGSLYYATEQTKLYRNVSVFFHIIGLPITYFLIASPEKMGFNTGAAGLAAKMVVLNIIAVNVRLYFNTRFLKLSFSRYLGHQIICVFFLLPAAYLATIGVELIDVLRQSIIISFLLSGVLYTVAVAGMGYAVPALFGVKREDIHSLLSSLRTKISNQT